MEPWSVELAGRIDEHEIESKALARNPLGDPATRPLWVYVPPGYDDDQERRYISIYVIQGLTGQLDMWRNRSAFRPNFLELTDRLFASGEATPAIVAFVDAWTSLGGSQYVNSQGTGRYHDYLCDEIVPFVDEWYLDLGARAVAKELDAIGVDYFFELFDGTHMAIEYRYPKSLAFLVDALST